MNSPVAAALSLLHFSLADGVVLIVEPVGQGKVRLMEQFPARQSLSPVLQLPFDLLQDGLATYSAEASRISLEWTLLCGVRPNQIAALRIPDHTCYLVCASTRPLPPLEILTAASSTIGLLLGAGGSTRWERETTQRVNAVIRHLPMPLLFVSSENPSIYMNDLARTLLGVQTSEGDEAGVSRALRRLLDHADASEHLSELSQNPHAHLVFESRSDGIDLHIETRWISDDAISGRLWLFSDISEAKDRERKLALMATHDALTGVPNRRAFEAALDQAIQSDSRFSILMIDLDHFKAINDTYGHPAGDKVLRQAAKIISGALRSGDALGRLGGEEFGVLLPDTVLAGAMEAAERIRLAVARSGISHGTSRLELTCSVGVAMRCSDDSVEKIICRADDALYAAKRLGRNRAEIAPASRQVRP